MSEIETGSLVWNHESEHYSFALKRVFGADGESFELVLSDKRIWKMCAIGVFPSKDSIRAAHQSVRFAGADAQLAALELGKAMAKMATMARPKLVSGGAA